jgi:hypothetical protein
MPPRKLGLDNRRENTDKYGDSPRMIPRSFFVKTGKIDAIDLPLPSSPLRFSFEKSLPL